MDKSSYSQTIWIDPNDERLVHIIDQRWLPHKVIIEKISTVSDMANAISEMHVRGAPLLGVCGAFGMYLAAINCNEAVANQHSYFENAAKCLIETRPTAVNLTWGVKRVLAAIIDLVKSNDNLVEIQKHSKELALKILANDIEMCRQIGLHGLKIIKEIQERKSGAPVNILTHCNAGWLACVKYGTATSPIYQAWEAGIKLHVFADETRPRNQGASLTAWELGQAGIPHTVIADNTGGHLMQRSEIDLVIVGSDRTTRTGDVANKIGTYLKALAAHDNNVPFYVALPSSTIDWDLNDGADIPIETRDPDEVRYISGLVDGEIKSVLLTPKNTTALNYGFDVTPARLVTGLITERGICSATEESILKLFPERIS